MLGWQVVPARRVKALFNFERREPSRFPFVSLEAVIILGR